MQSPVDPRSITLVEITTLLLDRSWKASTRGAWKRIFYKLSHSAKPTQPAEVTAFFEKK